MADEKGTERFAIAEVALNVPLRRSFDYLIPEALRGRVCVGGRVRVPFGRRKYELGYCIALKETTDVPESKLRPIVASLDEDEPVFTEQMLRLARWMADYYMCSYGEALHAGIPAAVHTRPKTRRVRVASLALRPAEALKAADGLFDSSPAQSKALRTLAAMGGKAPVNELKHSAGVSRATLKALEAKKLLTLAAESMESEDPLTQAAVVAAPLVAPHVLTPEQQRAYDLIVNKLDRATFDVVLLHGVTSSGKTEVYLQTIAECVRRGKQAIVLVPEISLTPQTVRHFRGRFRRLAVLHSRLTEAERRRYWHLIRAGEADVVIGARSAIFAPVPSLGLLVIDEEHENSFKQENVPRYHARDVGIMRAKGDNALVVLGSATPSLESYYNSVTGKYIGVRLRTRIGGVPLPPVEIVDMRHEWAGSRGVRVISRRLEDLMRESLSKQEQVILFINRRGFAPFIHCPRCGYVHKCRRCEITMNYHAAANVVACHYCGLEERPPNKCPECAHEDIRFSGTGTERVQDFVSRVFPDAACARMDSDSMKTRTAHEETLERFRDGRAQVLIGTQMIAKGLDFPNVTLVGVVNADVSLHLPDFRSRERTFQLLAQVAGRTGRGPAGGRVVIQTFMPDDPSIQAAASHNYERFAEGELAARRRLGYPPFGRMARIICRGPKKDAIERYMLVLAEEMRRECAERADGSQLLGPSPAPVARIKRAHRYHLMLKCPSAASIHGILDRVKAILDGPKGCRVIVDVDPITMI
jgi:primosomal protein N' (replication factor Y)